MHKFTFLSTNNAWKLFRKLKECLPAEPPRSQIVYIAIGGFSNVFCIVCKCKCYVDFYRVQCNEVKRKSKIKLWEELVYVCKWFPSVTFAVFVEGKHLHIYISYAFCPKPYPAPTLRQFQMFAKSHFALESYSCFSLHNFPFPMNSIYLTFLLFALLGMSCLSIDLCNELTKYWKKAQCLQTKWQM